jgi:hypothetical protein
MRKAHYVWLVLKAFCELLRYEVTISLGGFGRIQRQLSRQSTSTKPRVPGLEESICRAVQLAASLYWKPVLCLQRSVCAARLLRKHGIPGRLVIGYRPAPFFSHAWVEVDGRVVNGSAAWQTRLRLLYAIEG